MSRRPLFVSLSVVVALASLAVACGGEGQGTDGVEVEAVQPNFKLQGGGGNTNVSNLTDHGGPVLATSNTYAIDWGTQSDFPSDLRTGMASLLGGMNGSSYLQITAQYMHGATPSTSFKGDTIDTSAPPKNGASPMDLSNEVCKLFATPDPNGVYVIFTSNAPNVNYCAYHSKASCNGVTFEVAYVPNQAQMPSCSPTVTTDFHCNTYSAGTITSADAVAHELMESITDPLANAWYDKGKAEIADKCEADFQGCVTLANRTTWQLQSEWSNAISGCQQQ